VVRFHIVQLAPPALRTDDGGSLKALRVQQRAHKEFRRGRTARQVEVHVHIGVHGVGFAEQLRKVRALRLREEYFPHIVAVAQVGDAAGDGAGSHGNHAVHQLDRALELVGVFVVAHPTGNQQDLSIIRDAVRGDHQRHIHQFILVVPLRSVQERDLAAGAARKLQHRELG